MSNNLNETKKLINSIGNLSQNGFNHFVQYCLKEEYGDSLRRSSSSQDAWYTVDHRGDMDFSTFLFIANYLPYELFTSPYDIPFDNPLLRNRMQKLMAEMDKKKLLYVLQDGPLYYTVEKAPAEFCFFTNTISDNYEEIKDAAFSQLEKMLHDLRMNIIGRNVPRGLQLGSPYSFVDNTPTIVPKALQYAQSLETLFSIEYSDDGYEVNLLRQDKYVTSGVGRTTKDLFFPFVIIRTPDSICLELEKLLNSEPSEKELQEFLYDNYKLIFGNRYDRIQSEVSLRFPELDIAEKNRRIDLMIHDSVQNDWEIIELKKQIPITRLYRDIPSFTSDIIGAINQLRNYHDILMQQKVKERFLREGIEYYHPAMKLIVGGKPNVTHAQWRKLVSDIHDVQLLTYDSMIKEIKARYYVDDDIYGGKAIECILR